MNQFYYLHFHRTQFHHAKYQKIFLIHPIIMTICVMIPAPHPHIQTVSQIESHPWPCHHMMMGTNWWSTYNHLYKEHSHHSKSLSEVEIQFLILWYNITKKCDQWSVLILQTVRKQMGSCDMGPATVHHTDNLVQSGEIIVSIYQFNVWLSH